MTPTVSSAIDPRVTLHIVPDGAPVEAPVVIHAKPLSSSYTLYRVNPYNGEKYPMTLSKTKQAQFDALCARLNPKNTPDFSIDLQELTGLSGRDEFQLYSNNSDVMDVRDFVHAEWQSRFSWNMQLPGHRTSPSMPQSFSHASPRLNNLKFGDVEAEKAMQGKSFDQKLIQLKRSRAAQHLLEISGKILDQVSELVPNKQLQTENRKQLLLKQKELFDARLKAILQFEALHSTDATKQALETKCSAAKAWVESHPDLPLSERLWQRTLSTIDAEEETQFVEDMARLGCKTKEEYRILGAKDRAEGPEVFYTRLMEAVAVGNRDEIRNVVNGPLFDVVFSRLNSEDQASIKTQLIVEADKLAVLLPLSPAEAAQLNQVPDVNDRENFGLSLLARYDRIVDPKINP